MLFRHDQRLGCLAIAMLGEERREAVLHWAIVVFQPAMSGQDEVALWAVAVLFEDPDLRGSDVDLWVDALPVRLELRRSRRAQPRNLGDDQHSARLEEAAPGGDPSLEANVVDSTFRPDHVERTFRKRQRFHRTVDGGDLVRNALAVGSDLKFIKEGRQPVDSSNLGVEQRRQE